jgi:hypothetical protein
MAMAMPWESDGPDVKGLVVKEDISVGAGEEAAKGTTIKFDFTSRVVNGDDLDSAKGIAFELGKADVIPGWVEGLNGMRPGGVRKVTLPEALWKDAQPNVIKSVPKGAEIEFEFTMIEVKPKSFFDIIGIQPTTTNLVLGSLIVLIGFYEGYLAITGGDDGKMLGM